jgi:hypothetical protein
MDYMLMVYVDECFELGYGRGEMLTGVAHYFPGKGAEASRHWEVLQANYQVWLAIN